MYQTLSHVLLNYALLLAAGGAGATSLHYVMFGLGSAFPDLDRGGGLLAQEGRILPAFLMHVKPIRALMRLDNWIFMPMTKFIARRKWCRSQTNRPMSLGQGYLHIPAVAALGCAVALVLALFGHRAMMYFCAGWVLHIAATALTRGRVKYLYPFDYRRFVTGFIAANSYAEYFVALAAAMFILVMLI